MLWPGRWGATRRREYFEGDSPRGPREHPGWWDPAEPHREGRPWSGPLPTARLHPEAIPASVAIGARREEGLAVVDYNFDAPAAEQGEAARIIAAPVDEHGEVGPVRSFPIEERRGSLALQLPADRDWRGVRACAASALGVPGECETAALAAA